MGDGEYSIAELARLAKTDTGTMTREVRRLETPGFYTAGKSGAPSLSGKQGSAFLPCAARPGRHRPGPAEVLGDELGGLEGIEAAAIFGSWAARAAGEPGPSPIDIDLLVIGRTDRDDLHDAPTRPTGSDVKSTPSWSLPTGGTPGATRSWRNSPKTHGRVPRIPGTPGHSG